MTEDELIDKIYQGYEAGEILWGRESLEDKASVVAFYISALVFVYKKPYNSENVQSKVVEFLERKREEAIEKLPDEGVAYVGRLLEEINCYGKDIDVLFRFGQPSKV